MILLIAAAQVSDIKASDYFPMYRGERSETRALVQPYFDCAFHAAGKLENSGDAPTEVAKAAIDFCAPPREDLEASVDADVALAVSEQPLGIADKVMSKFDLWLENHLRMRIVAKRAMKATK